MLTLDANYIANCTKQTNSSIFKLDLETSYNRAKASLKEDWQGGSGDADISTIDGSVICKKTNVDQLSQTGYGTTNTGYISSTAIGNYYGIRIQPEYHVTIREMTFTYESSELSQIRIWEITDDLINYNQINWIGETVLYDLPIALTLTEITVAVEFSLRANRKYYIGLAVSDEVDHVKKFNLWIPNTDIIDVKGIKGFNDKGFKIAHAIVVPNGNYIRKEDSYWTALQAYGLTMADSFDGGCPIKTMKVEAFTDSSLTTKLFTVLDQYGTAQTAEVGQFRASEKTPVDTDVEYDVHKYAEGKRITSLALSAGTATVTAVAHGYSNGDVIYVFNSGVPQTAYTITVTGTDTFTFTAAGSGTTYGGSCYKKTGEITTVIDGEAIDFDGVPNCRFVMRLSTDEWYKTPIVDAVEAYFPTSQSFVRSDDSYGTYKPHLHSITSYEIQLDPIASKCSIGEPQFKMLLDRLPDKSLSEVEQLIYNSYLTGNEAAVALGYKGMSSGFCPVTTGIIKDYTYDDLYLTITCSDVLRLTKDPFGFDPGSGLEEVLYAYWHPVDIILDMLYRIGIPHRLIDTASFTTVKTQFVGWQFFRYFKEQETDLKSLIDEICELLGVFLIPQEDGIVYLSYPFDSASVFTFNSDNSYPIGKAEMNIDKRINQCQVRRGFWDEYNCEENEDQYWTTVLNYDSMRETNQNTVKVYDNKWIPLSVTIGGKLISQIVGERITQRFGYGVTFIRRGTPIGGDEYAKVQVGDKVTVVTDQILKRGTSGLQTKSAIVTSKLFNTENATIEWGLWVL